MTTPLLATRDLRRTYGEGEAAVHALTGVTFDLHTGGTTAIVGRSGSGKSTLMHLLALLDTPTRGEVLVDGVDTRQLSAGELARIRGDRFGFVFQQFFLMPHLTVLENVMLPLTIAGTSRRERARRTRAQIEALGLGHRVDARATALSGGERQRAAIARALVGEPEVLFADEPTGNLDSANGATVEDLLLGLAADRGITVVVVTHDDALAARCDRRVAIADGRLVGDSAADGGLLGGMPPAPVSVAAHRAEVAA